MAMDYPYTDVTCRTGDGESSATIGFKVTESGVSVDQSEFVSLIRTYLEGLPGVVSSGATRYTVSTEAL